MLAVTADEFREWVFCVMDIHADDLQVLLTRAAAQMQSRGGVGNLLRSFLRELQQGSVEGIRLFEITGTEARLIVSEGHVEDRQDLRDQIGKSVEHLRQGRGGSFPSGFADGRFCLSSAELADSHFLLIVAQGADCRQPFVDGVVDICADLYRRELVGELRKSADRRTSLDSFLAQLYRSNDEVSVANILATDGAAILGCDRISVCRRNALGSWHLMAATSVSDPNRRADAVRQICAAVEFAEQLAGREDGAGADPTGGSENSAALASSQQVLPLSIDGQWKSSQHAMLIDWGATSNSDRRTTAIIRLHASVAVSNVTDKSRLAWGPMRWVAGVRHRWSVRLILLSAFGLLLFLMFWPMELTIEAPGVLEPFRRQYIWAPDAGVVYQVTATEGQDLPEGGEILRIRNDELILQRESLQGELAESKARLSAIESQRVGREAVRGPTGLPEQAETQERIRSLEEQLRLTELRIAELTVTTPFSGRLIGTDLKERFLGRPVIRGQHFCEVVDINEPWEIRIQVRESEVRYLLDAIRSQGQNPDVTFVLETQPDTFTTVQITEVAQTTRLDAYGNLTTEVVARLPNKPLGSDRPGTGVQGRIHCGTRSAGFVFFRQAIDYLRRMIFI